mmetsp:Transcript_38037/g.93489  ORF Transcript_38037/g.93489 Transcript_38037/m.93489 type:complete len:318 (-) Transcript_38037:522-1475(-)|eukprot:CAMPEP_0206230854 /NCGR_PEP_ID=MMETSP0047_2-20121206/10507_1 /ASSEMBLY_ACC=CAM_ASM_000192 /TAXON_ID=195065 /ORGANISM="Chroomonas mesostigmatica_cf, Strain CCMP1168" /LENGTH=317 /DNA_ID=CAMNT_0053654357 /DNA_START=186 /DNA_END=1139 /DNA_ORIENTATION=+
MQRGALILLLAAAWALALAPPAHGLAVPPLGAPRSSRAHKPTPNFERSLSAGSLAIKRFLDSHPDFHRRRRDWQRQVVLFALSLTTTAAIMSSAHTKGPSFAEAFQGRNPFLPHLPSVMLAFASADFVSQLVEMQSSDKKHVAHGLDVWRLLSAGIVGCFLAGFGTIIWFHYFNILFPPESVGLQSTEGICMLLAKTLIHSFAWGTISNSLGIVLRRIASGDSLYQACVFWRDRILGVTLRNFYFWPLWQLVAFSLVPGAYLVPLNTFGAFLWNSFLSWMSSHTPRKPVIRSSPLERVGSMLQGLMRQGRAESVAYA